MGLFTCFVGSRSLSPFVFGWWCFGLNPWPHTCHAKASALPLNYNPSLSFTILNVLTNFYEILHLYIGTGDLTQGYFTTELYFQTFYILRKGLLELLRALPRCWVVLLVLLHQPPESLELQACTSIPGVKLFLYVSFRR